MNAAPSLLPARPHRGRRLLASAVTALLVGAGGALAVAAPASAATFTVDSTTDDGVGMTLRDAVDAAEANVGVADLIEFDASLIGQTLQLDEAIHVTESLTISGPGSADLTIIRTLGGAPIFDFFQFNPLAVDQDFAISGLTISGDGVRTGSGLAVTNFEEAPRDIDVTDVIFENLVSASGGPGVVATGASTIDIFDSVFENNETVDEGGAVRLAETSGNVAIGNSIFSGNSADLNGGAVSITEQGGSFSAEGSSFLGNSSGQDGGAIAITTLGDTSAIAGSFFDSNTAVGQGGAVRLGSTGEEIFFVFDSTFSSNVTGGEAQSESAGGALYIGEVVGALVVSGSTFNNNQIDQEDVARFGRSIAIGELDGNGGISNSTFDELASTAEDPEPEFAIQIQTVSADSVFDIEHTTITGPGGLRIGTNGDSVNVTHTLIDALGAAPAIELDELPSNPVNVQWSLLTTLLDPTYVFDAGNNQFGVPDLGLEPLADNGGPTWTRLPAVDSPAREAGDPAITTEPDFDQRGEGFPRVLTRIDIGAVETEFVLPATGAVNNPILPISAAVLLLAGLGALVFSLVRRKRLKDDSEIS